MKDILHVNHDGTRWVADIFKPEFGEGGTEVRLKRRLAAGEQWPPPTPEPPPDPEAARRERDIERLQQDLQGFLLHSPESPLDPTSREQMARRVAWQREHGGNR
jgi:hypothetical protein